MSKQKHIIHRQVLDVEVPSVESAWEIQNRISHYYQNNLQEAISEMFDSITGADETLRIDKLEIDLGQLKYGNLEEEINAKIKDILKEKLVQLKQKAEGTSASNLQEAVSLHKDLSQFSSVDFAVHFLRSGTAPWWYKREEFGTILEIFQNLIEKRTQLIKSFFPDLLRYENVRKRIVRVFSDELIFKLVRIFNSETSSFAALFLNRVVQSEIAVKFASKSNSDSVNSGKKTDSDFTSPTQQLIAVRAEFLDAVLQTISDRFNNPVRTYFKTHEILLPDNNLTEQIRAELKQVSAGINLQLKTILLDKSSNLILAKPAEKKHKRIRRKRTPDNLKREEEFTVDENGNVIEEAGFSVVANIESDSISDEQHVFLHSGDGADFNSIDISDTTEETDAAGNSPEKNAGDAGKSLKNNQQRKPARKKKFTDDEIAEQSSVAKKTEPELNLISDSISITESEQENLNPGKGLDFQSEGTVSENAIDSNDEFSEDSVLKAKKSEDKTKAEEQRKISLAEIAPEDLADFVIDNAGLVLVWPYLGAFFRELGLVSERKFVDEAAAGRAVHLLQYICDKGEFEYEEHDLVLNKILCGIGITEPIDMHFEITEREMDEVEGLLAGVRTNWNALGSTSNNGLRISFLRKEGSLKKNEQGWNLSIERTTIDMLLDRLPWSISIIRLPWSKDLLYVEW